MSFFSPGDYSADLDLLVSPFLSSTIVKDLFMEWFVPCEGLKDMIGLELIDWYNLVDQLAERVDYQKGIPSFYENKGWRDKTESGKTRSNKAPYAGVSQGSMRP